MEILLTFNGQCGVDVEGKKYPIPANYISKSKLIEGDLLSFKNYQTGVFYKQIKPVHRKNILARYVGERFVTAFGTYKAIRQALLYHKVQEGDECLIVIRADNQGEYCAIEGKIQ